MALGKCKYLTCFITCILFLHIPTAAQKTYKFKIRSPKLTCTITVKDSLLWLDRDNVIQVTVTNPKGSTKVSVLNGTILKKAGEEYTVSFDNGGKTVISVYQYENGNFRLIHSQSMNVEEPVIYFCGVKVGTKAEGLKMREEHLIAKSIPYNNTALKIKGYDMVYFDGISNYTFHSDTTLLSKKMTDIIFEKPLRKNDQSFRFGQNKRVYFANINAVMPDGKEKFLTPFELFLETDSTKKDDLAFIFSIQRLYSKKAMGEQ